MKQPNILLLMSDQHPFAFAGCYGHPTIKTPTMDRLAEQGVVFDSAYCASPFCAPSRAAMLTGRHVHTIGVWDNAAPLGCDWPTMAHDFCASGYRTILSGKMHFVGPDQNHGFEERWTQDIYPAGFDWTLSNREKLAVKPLGGGQDRNRVFQSGIGWTPDMDYDEEVIFRTELGLRRTAREKERRPFFLCVSFTGPHYPFYAPQRYWDLYGEQEVPLPELRKDYMERHFAHSRWLREAMHLDEAVPDDVVRRARHAAMGRVSLIDDYLDRILTLLQRLGMADKTYVVYTSDHGDNMGEHGLWFKQSTYEWSSRVPLLISRPGILSRRIAEAAGHLDLRPTLASLAGIQPVHPEYDGRDLSPLLLGEREQEDGEAICEFYGDGAHRGWRMIRSGRHKLTCVPGHGVELFDLESDPGEWENTASDPAYEEIVARLTDRLMEDWDPDLCDEQRYRSEERRLAIKRACGPADSQAWKAVSPSVPHPSTGHELRSPLEL